MRTFEHFPDNDNTKCPICGKNEDGECFLIPIDGTGDGRICEAQPTHYDCAKKMLGKLRYNKEHHLIYFVTEGE